MLTSSFAKSAWSLTPTLWPWTIPRSRRCRIAGAGHSPTKRSAALFRPTWHAAPSVSPKIW